MSSSDPYGHATLAGERLVIVELKITTLPINPIEIAEKANIVVKPKLATTAGVSGMLIRVDSNFAIMYATHIDNVGFQRFSIAHELGHYYLPGHPDAVLDSTGVHESRASFVSKDKYEREADHFATGLLMPRSLFTPAMRQAGEGIAAIENLATRCETSILATAIRYAECASEPVAVIVSEGRQIDYCVMSQSLKKIPGIDWIKKREPLPKNSATFVFNEDTTHVSGADRVNDSGDLSDWFGGSRRIELQEDVVGLGSYGKTLTLLFGIEEPDEEEDEEEEALVESWTPRFRR